MSKNRTNERMEADLNKSPPRDAHHIEVSWHQEA